MEPDRWMRVKELFVEGLKKDGADRTSFLDSLDPTIRRDVESLISNYEAAEDFIEVSPVAGLGLNGDLPGTEWRVGTRIDGYKILRPIGSGGMGTVFLAEHDSEGFSHPVALKLIKAGMDSAAVLKRFVRERRILADLEHPYIARFLDGGSDSEGMPYFVMEYVDGVNIRRYCEERALGTRSRLELFLKVCSAVSYAHQNLVVHRDIKPSNILVTKQGDPRLLDFGVAKLLNPERSADADEVTATMFRVLTPEYASPEQIRGETVTTSTDVYSLGVVLYELLTGSRPYRSQGRSADDLASRIAAEEPVRPSSVVSIRPAKHQDTDAAGRSATDPGKPTDAYTNARSARELRGDIDNIILKALQTSPTRRYASVHQFADDIRRHLDGLPVSATGDSFAYRAKKFVSRHRAGVLAAASVFLILLSASLVTAWQAQRANLERAKAEQRLAQLRSLTNSFLFEFHDSISELPGSTEARSLVIEKAREYLEILAGENQTDPTLRFELAVAYAKVARLQGASHATGTGDSEAARSNYHKAREILESLVTASPEDRAYLRELARVYIDLTVVSAQRGEREDLIAQNRRAVELLERILATDPADADSQSSLAETYKSLGDYTSSSGDLAGSLANYRKASELSGAVLNRDPADMYAEKQKMMADEAIAATLGNPNYTNLGDKEGALTVYQAMTENIRRRAAEYPNDGFMQANLGYFLQNTGLVLGSLDRWTEALANYEAALAVQRSLAAADKNNTVVRWRMANMLTDIGEAYSRLGRHREAEASHRAAIEIFQALTERDPANSAMLQFHARSLQRYADALRAKGSHVDAEAFYAKAIAIDQAMADEDEENMDIRWALADDYAKLGRMYLAAAERSTGRSENLAKARHNLEKSVAVYELMRSRGLEIKPVVDSIADLRKDLLKCGSTAG